MLIETNFDSNSDISNYSSICMVNLVVFWKYFASIACEWITLTSVSKQKPQNNTTQTVKTHSNGNLFYTFSPHLITAKLSRNVEFRLIYQIQ